jgi:hypothetical protein
MAPTSFGLPLQIKTQVKNPLTHLIASEKALIGFLAILFIMCAIATRYTSNVLSTTPATRCPGLGSTYIKVSSVCAVPLSIGAARMSGLGVPTVLGGQPYWADQSCPLFACGF